MDLRYKLLYENNEKDTLLISWAFDKGKNYVAGDCRVRGILDITKGQPCCGCRSFSDVVSSEPMTLDEVRKYVKENATMLGRVNDCVGMVLDDVSCIIDFPERIKIGKR